MESFAIAVQEKFTGPWQFRTLKSFNSVSDLYNWIANDADETDIENCKSSVMIKYKGKVGELKMVPTKNVIVKTDGISKNITLALDKNMYRGELRSVALKVKTKLS